MISDGSAAAEGREWRHRSFCLYICASVDSKNAVAAPKNAISHIQNIAPGPPSTMAVATPAILPVP